MDSLVVIFTEDSGRGLCKRIIAVIKAANTLGYSFYEAFDKQPIELLQLFSLKAQEAFEEAKLKDCQYMSRTKDLINIKYH